MGRTMALVPVLMAAACSDSGGGDGTGSESGPSGIVLTVVVADEVVSEWTLAELQEDLEFVALVLDGDEQIGPRLLDALEGSEVGDWQTAEVLGKGEGRSFDVGVEIAAADVDGGWLFDVTNRGTLKLVAADLPREQWVRDAGEIRIP